MYRIAQTALWTLVLVCAAAYTVAHWPDMGVTSRLVCLGLGAALASMVYASAVETED